MRRSTPRGRGRGRLRNGSTEVRKDGEMSEQRIKVTMINHVAIEIAASPDSVWQAILDDYVEAKKFREMGAIDPLDDPAATLGGYRLRFEQDGAVVDERIIHFTE